MTRIAIATAARVQEGKWDADEPLLLAALERAGIEATLAVWDDPAVDWAAFPVTVIRSTWDYVGNRDAFVAWAEHVASVGTLANPARIIRWNTDKRYLAELAAAGVPVVPTAWAGPGDPNAIDGLLPDGARRFVVKPTVSAGAQDTTRYDAGSAAERAAAEAHVARLQAEGRSAMVQPYLEAVEEVGETALIHLGGVFSHSICKGPLLRTGSAPALEDYVEEITSRTPSAVEHEAAKAVLAAVPAEFGDLLYARVDLIPGPDGTPLLIELEATEPSLFLRHEPTAADRLAAAIAALL